MDKTTRFFAKLRSLAVHLDTQRAHLEHTASQYQDQEDDDTESAALQALHDLHSEVRGLKKQVQTQVSSQEDESIELRSFIKACMVLKQRTTADIEQIQRHYEKYGYKPQKFNLKPELKDCKDETDARFSGGDDPEGKPSEETAEAPECKTPKKVPAPLLDPMRTPQLSDFGLSVLHLQMVLGNPEISQDGASFPVVPLTPPSLIMTAHESQPKTPKCSLSMDETLTPRLEDFGITESTMCFNNDFTMDLFRKKPPKDKKTTSPPQEIVQNPSQSLPSAPVCVSLGRFSDSIESPEVPVFSTLEIKANKQLGQPSSVLNKVSDPESPSQPNAASATPELPTFETPYINRLVSTRKETKQNEEAGLTGSLKSTSYPKEGSFVGVPSSEVPQMPACLSQMDNTPEMPRLQSFFSSTLPCLGSVVTEPPGCLLQADEYTQEWCLATPRVRMVFDVEPHTPEMPEMSSITQDIFKVVAQASNKQTTLTSAHTKLKPNLNTLVHGKENRIQSVAQESKKEFLGLAYCRSHSPVSM